MLHCRYDEVTQKSYGSSTIDFDYDKTYQLKSVDYSGGSTDDWTFNYDHVNNRTSTVQDSTTRTYTLKTNGLNQYDTLSNPSVSFSYTNGNLTNDGTNKYTFNAENYLTTLKDQSDNTVASYTYDWAGRRITKTYNSVTTTYVYDGPHIIAEYEGSTLKKKYVYGPGIDLPVMMIAVDGETETRYYYFRDAVGSVVALLNNAGSVVEAYSYDPFGKPTIYTSAGTNGKWLVDGGSTASSSAFGNRLMFTAREWDSESGLYYYRARMYHPTTGRFLQTDPVRYYDSMNLYTYCRNNPINRIDPMGRMEISPLDWFLHVMLEGMLDGLFGSEKCPHDGQDIVPVQDANGNWHSVVPHWDGDKWTTPYDNHVHNPFGDPTTEPKYNPHRPDPDGPEIVPPLPDYWPLIGPPLP